MRRFAAILFASMTAVLFVLAGPALAAEDAEEHAEEEAGDHGDEATKATGFGTGDWDGLILAALGGLVAGGLVYASSGGGASAAHHDAHDDDHDHELAH